MIFAVLTGVFGVVAPARAQVPAGPVEAARGAEAVVVEGAQIPSWSRLSAVAAPAAWPQGALVGERDAHAGTLVVPPDAGLAVPTDEIAAFRWDGGRFVEIPVQVDERFPYVLANPDSSFGLYSAVDEELTYAWDVESWKKTAGACETAYPPGVGPTPDPAAGLDNDDEIVFMASDAGAQAPLGARGPSSTRPDRQEVAVVDPLTGAPTFVYLFRRDGGSSFDHTNGYVTYDRDDDADQWIDRHFYAAGDPEQLGSSNTGYGPNLSGTVCQDGVVRNSTDRFPRDGVTVTTDTYKWRASGRWMVRGMHVTKPGTKGTYGPDLIDRWKGRAFQQSPDSSISLVGFEDEQVNWEANSSLIGERKGPVRAIRETWGADSGTNTTKTEIFYRDFVQYHYHLRVHPVPPDGLYQIWDYNKGVAVKYYNAVKSEGVDIDGVPDDAGNVDEIGGQPAFFDVPDPTFGLPLAVLNWQQVSGTGDSGSLVYVTNSDSPTSFENPAVFPYYNDDKCFDDGTGDDPVARPYPGEASTDQRVRDGYTQLAGKATYGDVTCDERQGAWGAHGVHFLFTNDTDNAFQSKPLTELVATESQFAVPTSQPRAVGEPYANVVRAPLETVVVPQMVEPMRSSSIAYTGAVSGEIGDEATLSAALSDDAGPIAGAQVSFIFRGKAIAATTDPQGLASVSVPVAGPAGSVGVGVSFEGDATHEASSDSATFTVERDAPGLTFRATKRSGGGRSTVTAHLWDRDTGAGIAGAPIAILVNGTQRATATTDGNGLAAVRITAPKKGQTVEVRFAGDDTYEPAASSARYDPKRGAGTTA